MSREQDRLFIRNFMAVLAALVGVTLVLILAVNMAFDENREGPTAVERERAAQRLQPVGQVRVAPAQAQPPAGTDAGSAPSREAAAKPPAPEQTAPQPVPASPAATGEATAAGSTAEPSAASSGPPGDRSQRQPAAPAQSDAATAGAPAAGDGAPTSADSSANAGQASQVAHGDAADGAPASGKAAGGNGDATSTPAQPAMPAAKSAAAPEQPAAEASPAAPPAEDLTAGRALTEGMCNVCHANQFLNSPQVGNPTAWKPRLERDLATLVRHVQNGYGNMPPQAAFGTREEIRKAILWMVEEKTGLEVKR